MFLVTHASGVVLIDVGTVGSHGAIGAGLARVGARWDDISDVVLTHRHPDHVGGLAEVVASASHARVWAGADDRAAIPFDGELQGLVDGGSVRELRVLHTPGHTPGHCSFVLDEGSILFAGDIVGSVGSSLSRGPAPFTADPGVAEESLRWIAGLEFDRVLFGHGGEIPDPLGALRGLLIQATSGPSN